MTNISKQILLICALAGAFSVPVAADPLGGLDPSLSPAARAKVNARDQASINAAKQLEGVPRANGRVFGQVDTDVNGNFLIPGIDAGVKGQAISGAPRSGHITGGRLGVHNSGTGGRIGLNDVPKVHTGGNAAPKVHNVGAGARVGFNAPAPKVAPSAPRLHTPH
jgi:hypothetical protein